MQSTLFDEPAQPRPAASARLFARVALNLGVRTEFSYAVPAEMEALIGPGMRVLVPFATRREIGVVAELSREPGVEAGKLRALLRLLDAEPVVDLALLGLTRWMAEEYACAWGEALAAILPAPLKRERSARTVKVVRATERAREALAALEAKHEKQHRVLRTLLELEGPIEMRDLLRKLNLGSSPVETLASAGLVAIERVEKDHLDLLAGSSDRPRHQELSAAQTSALAAIVAAVDARRPATFLLQGVTGSGKTEVYLRAIEHALAAGRGAIVLVPEIALTPQTVSWFRSRFGGVAVLHSRMTDAQRLAMWRAIQRGQARVVVGARSAVFAPVPDLGVIVVDEEHEPSFKQGSTPRYHAREVAIERARRSGAVCVLGSATPSLESWEHARRGEWQRLVLPERVRGKPPPPVRIVDMRVERCTRESLGLFSQPLHAALAGALERGEQAILFLNRRGYTPVLWCQGCQTTVRCKQCDLALAWHKRIGRLVCHSCCEELPAPRVCPSCSRAGLKPLGVGSERVEAAVSAAFAGARVKRMDSDTMLRREDYENALEAFGRRDIDVLVGTQMIAKGLDFPGVTVVGVVSADTGLHLPDFRAAERTFQLLAQVAGRAGRGERPGLIVFQTIAPAHPALLRAAANDFEGFAAEESESRRELGYPPFGRVLRVLLEDEDERRVREGAAEVARALREALEGSEAQVLGPAPAPIEQARGRWRHHLLVKTALEGNDLARARDTLLALAEGMQRPKLAIDVDPQSLL